MAEWSSPIMTRNNAPSPYVVSASSEYSADYAAWKAMDGSSASLNYWNTVVGNPANVAWWKLYTINPICITTITIKNLTSYGYNVFKYQGSNDDINWTDIYTGTCDNNNNIQTFNSLGNTHYYHYHRIFCVTCYSASYLVIQEFSFVGDEDIVAVPQNYIWKKRNRLDLSAVTGEQMKRYNGICYPPLFSDAYVKATTAYSSNLREWNVVNPSKSLTGVDMGNQWYAVEKTVTNQRFHIDIGVPKIVNKIYYENSHSQGNGTDLGVKDFTFWGSDSVVSFNNITYSSDTGWTQLTTSQSSFDQHVSLDQADPKYIDVYNAKAYRYYGFKFANNYGSTFALGIRRIGLISVLRNCVHSRRDRLDMSGVTGIVNN